MSQYELTLVLKEGADPKDLALGKIKTKKSWGLKDLAYQIKGAKKGGCFYYELALEPKELPGLTKSLEQNEQVLRHLLISQR